MIAPDRLKSDSRKENPNPVELDLTKYIDESERTFREIEPKVLAFVEVEERFERLRKEAQILQKRFPKGSIRPKFFGIPVGIKDIFHVDGFETRAGSQLSPDLLKSKEAESVRLLKDAGALIMGKTVTTEFAYFAPGPTRNPHNLKHTPGGSSSGSAAAVAAGLVDYALGTQTIGSVIRPAAFTGVVGYKPSYDRISRKGVIPLSPSLDHVGSFAQSVWMTKLGASVLVRDWREDVKVDERPTLGIPKGNYLEHADAEMLDHFWETIKLLKQAGYRVRERRLFPDYDEIAARHELILEGESAIVHHAWFDLHCALYHKQTSDLIEKGLRISREELRKAILDAKHFSRTISTVMDIDDIDIWAVPAAPGAAPKGLGATGNPVMNLPWTQAGLPVLGLPSGKAKNGLPLGMQFCADFGKDEELLEWGFELESVLESSK